MAEGDVTLRTVSSFEDTEAKQAQKAYQRQKDTVDAIKKSSDLATNAAESLADALAKSQRSRALQQIADDAAQGKITIDQATDALRRMGATEGEVAQVGKAIDTISDRLRRAESEADEFRNSLEGALQRADEINSRTRRDVGIIGDVETSGLAIGGALGRFGATGAESAIGAGGEIFAAAEGLAQLRGAAGGLGPVLRNLVSTIGASGFGLIAAVVGLGVALKVAGDQAAAARKQVESYAEGLRQAREFSIDATGSDLAARQQGLIQQREVLESLRDTYQQTLNDAENALGQGAEVLGVEIPGTVTRGLAELSSIAGIGATQLGEFRGKIDDVESEIRQINTELTAFEDATVQARIAANTAAEAEERLAAARQSEFDNLVERRRQIDLFLSDPDTDSSALQARIDGLERERDALENAARVYGLSEEAQAQYRQELALLNYEIDTLTNQGQILLDMRGDEIDLIQRQIEVMAANEQAAVDAITERYATEERIRRAAAESSIEDATAVFEAARREQAAIRAQIEELQGLDTDAARTQIEALQGRLLELAGDVSVFGEALPGILDRAGTDFARDIAKIQTDAAANITKINEQLEQQLAGIADTIRKAEQQRDTQLAGAEQQAAAARLKAVRSFQQASIEAERETAAKREKIIRDSGRAIQNAIAARDALAAYQAAQQRDAQLTDLDAEAEARNEKIIEQYRNQTAIIEANLIEQRQKINAAYRQQVQDANTAAAAARAAAQQQINTVRQKEQAEIQLRQQAFTQQLDQLSQWATGSAGIIRSFVQNTLSSLNLLSGSMGGNINTTVPFTLNVNNANGGRLNSTQRNEVLRQVNDAIHNIFSSVSATSGRDQF